MSAIPCGAPALLAQLVEHLHGKEGVDGSSPSEGFHLLPAQGQLSLSGRTRCGLFSVHRMSTNVHRLRVEGVE